MSRIPVEWYRQLTFPVYVICLLLIMLTELIGHVAGGAQSWLDQYRFDLERREIGAILSPGPSEAFLRLAVGLVDEVILAHAIKTRTTNPWSNAQEALVLYAQNARPMLVNAAWLTLITWVLAALVFLVVLGPAAAVG